MENAVRKYIHAIGPELIVLGVLFIAVAVFSCSAAVEAKSASEKLTILIPLRLAVNGFVATSTRLEVPLPRRAASPSTISHGQLCRNLSSRWLSPACRNTWHQPPRRRCDALGGAEMRIRRLQLHGQIGLRVRERPRRPIGPAV